VQVPEFTDFASALDSDSYKPVPDDWLIAIGDVAGSTPAIAAGRYKDVNLAGAATIAAVQNACPNVELPFAFGGDGGIVLVPAEQGSASRRALAGVQKISRNVLNLDLRCALVPVAAIRKKGKDVRIAFLAMTPQRRLAMISGGGIDCAEMIAKSPEGAAFAVIVTDTTQDADLSGLSCRWSPLQSQNGVMLSVIIRARDETAVLPDAYRTIYTRIKNIVRCDACPVTFEGLKSNWPPRGASAERAFGHSVFQVYGQSLLAKFSELTGLAVGGYHGAQYKRALPSHSDYRKFSDSLRLVIDCSAPEADHIESILAAARRQNLIDYGLHRASAALMTCFVSSTEDGKHVHFIDGADGGYALAAQQIKAQIAEGR